MKKIVLLLFICICYPYFGGGYAGAPFRFGSNARAVSLSNSVVSTLNNGFNAMTNPALLSQLKKTEFGASLFPMSMDRSIQSFLFSRRLPPTAGVAISLFRSGIDNNYGYDNTGESTELSYNSWEGYAMLSFGTTFNKLSIGVNIKSLNNSLTNSVKASGLGFDIGAFYKINNNNNIGFMITNVSGSYKWNFNYDNSKYQYEEKLPTILSIGSSSLVNSFLVLSQVDFIVLNKSDTPSEVNSITDEIEYFQLENKTESKLRLGLEYDMSDILSKSILLRFGVNQKYSDNFKDYNVTMGFGIPFIIDNIKLDFDYAISLNSMNVNFNQLFSISFLYD